MISTIRPFLAQPADFQPELVEAMSKAFEEVCRLLRIEPEQTHERETVAELIVDLARAGVRDVDELRDQAMNKF